MLKTNDVKENFSALLRSSLKARYGRLPSAAVLAREFNLRAYDTTPISGESARRWLRGVCLPEEERLRILVNWLDLDFNKALTANRNGMGSFASHRIPETSKQWFTNGQSGRPETNGLLHSAAIPDTPDDRSPAQPAENARPNGHARSDDELIHMILQLPPAERDLIKDLIKISIHKVPPPQ
ncbi:MAG: hypothetical protein RL258_280 [Pseudomonadota bacterium]|jgi:hypothetical protein